jgi:hypothetical protein
LLANADGVVRARRSTSARQALAHHHQPPAERRRSSPPPPSDSTLVPTSEVSTRLSPNSSRAGPCSILRSPASLRRNRLRRGRVAARLSARASAAIQHRSDCCPRRAISPVWPCAVAPSSTPEATPIPPAPQSRSPRRWRPRSSRSSNAALPCSFSRSSAPSAKTGMASEVSERQAHRDQQQTSVEERITSALTKAARPVAPPSPQQAAPPNLAGDVILPLPEQSCAAASRMLYGAPEAEVESRTEGSMAAPSLGRSAGLIIEVARTTAARPRPDARLQTASTIQKKNRGILKNRSMLKHRRPDLRAPISPRPMRARGLISTLPLQM